MHDDDYPFQIFFYHARKSTLLIFSSVMNRQRSNCLPTKTKASLSFLSLFNY